MCFSPVASFTASALLIPIGIYCAITAFQKNKLFLLLALVPFFFGVQQFVEGLIWLQLLAGQQPLAYLFAYIYLFFAFAFWPIYMPLTVYLIEDQKLIKKIALLFVIAGIILASILYGPILIGAVLFKTAIINHEIFYDVYQSESLMWFYSALYSAIVILPLLMCSRFRVKIYGLLVLVSLFAAYWWYLSQFTSVWCFFAAILSIYILYIVSKLRGKK